MKLLIFDADMTSIESFNQKRPLETDSAEFEAKYFSLKFQSLRVIFALLIREMATSFGRSKLGYLWAILEPVGGTAVLALGFSFLFHQPPIGTSFMLFYASGYIPFSCYMATYGQISTALRVNKPLLFYPVVTFVDVIVARVILITVTQVTVAMVVFCGIFLLAETGAQLNPFGVLLSLLTAVLLGVGVGLVNAGIIAVMPSWQSIWSIINRPIFFLSCVFFVFEDMPEKMRQFLWWNPLVHIIGEMRKGIYAEYEGEYVSLLYVTLISLILLVIGLINMRALNRFIMNN